MKEKPNEKDPKQGLSKRDKFKAMLKKGKGKDGKEKTEESDREARAHALVDMMLEDEGDDEKEPEGDKKSKDGEDADDHKDDDDKEDGDE